MDVGITGHNGFLGKYVWNKLSSANMSLEGFDLPDNDLFDDNQLNSFVKDKDVIIHLAAQNRADDVTLWKTNTEGLLKLLIAIKKHGKTGCRFVFASSFQVYTPTFTPKKIKESSDTEANGIYGLSKLAGEALVRSYCKNHAILRMSNIYGPGGKPFYNSVIATFSHLIKEGKTLTINGDGSSTRDFVFVEDVADAIEKAVSSGKTGTYNICTGEAVSLNKIIKIISKILKKKVDLKYEPAAEKELKTKGSFDKAKEELGWQPKTSFAEGMKKVLGV